MSREDIADYAEDIVLVVFFLIWVAVGLGLVVMVWRQVLA